jgi:hypothetical protein
MSNTLNHIKQTSNLQQLLIAELQAGQVKTKAKSKSAFECTFKLARLVNQSTIYFKTKECKGNLEKIGVTWTMKEFFVNLGEGFSKEWCYRLIKAVSLEFKADSEGNKTSMLDKYLLNSTTFSIADFIKFASDIKEEKEKEAFKLKLVFNDIKLSINSKDELATDLTKADIKLIMVLLQRKMDTMTEK